MIFSNQLKSRSKSRTQSAKMPSKQASRPLSGISSRQYQKTQLITNAYGNKESSPQAKKSFIKNMINYGHLQTEENAKVKRYSNVVVTTKGKEQLFQENMKLKKEINRVNGQLTIMKAKFEVNQKKSSQRNKKLDLQFQKPLYWGGSQSHLIQGIKSQYEKLKKKYNELEIQNINLKKQLFDSRAPQFKIYADAVQEENQRLIKKIQKFQQMSMLTENKSERMAREYILEQSEQKNRKLISKIEGMDIELKNQKQRVLEKDNKIMFLEKLIIEKDNRQHHMGMKVKKVQKNYSQIQEKYQILKEKYAKIKKQNQYQMEALNEDWQRRYDMRQSQLNGQISQRNQKIRKLEDDLKKMQEMGGSTVRKTKMGSSGVYQNNSDVRNISSSLIFGGNNKNSMLKVSQTEQKVEEVPLVNQKKYQSTYSQNVDIIEGLDEDEEEKNKIQQPKTRQMKRANERNSQNSKKCRKVQLSQVQQIGEFIKYKLIDAEISMNKMKQLFEMKQKPLQKSEKIQDEEQRNDQQDSNKQQEKIDEQAQWNRQYITMQQVIQNLQNSPFNLSETQGQLLSRYLIEDCEDQFVLSDLCNQNKREVVKSIMKAVVGEYQVPNEEDNKKYMEFMKRYGTNIQGTLGTLYPQGTVSKSKLIDILNSMGATDQGQNRNILIAKMARYSQNINELDYSKCFKTIYEPKMKESKQLEIKQIDNQHIKNEEKINDDAKKDKNQENNKNEIKQEPESKVNNENQEDEIKQQSQQKIKEINQVIKDRNEKQLDQKDHTKGKNEGQDERKDEKQKKQANKKDI